MTCLPAVTALDALVELLASTGDTSAR